MGKVQVSQDLGWKYPAPNSSSTTYWLNHYFLIAWFSLHSAFPSPFKIPCFTHFSIWGCTQISDSGGVHNSQFQGTVHNYEILPNVSFINFLIRAVHNIWGLFTGASIILRFGGLFTIMR